MVNWIESEKDAEGAMAKARLNSATWPRRRSQVQLCHVRQFLRRRPANCGLPLVAAVVPEVNQRPVPNRSLAKRISDWLGQVNTTRNKRAKASKAGQHVGVTGRWILDLLQERLVPSGQQVRARQGER